MEVKEWKYRAEGNVGLVIANSKERNVLRLTKRNCKKEKKLKVGTLSIDVILKRQLEFVAKVMAPSLGQQFVKCGELIEITAEFIREINNKCQDQRPESRRHQEADISLPYAVQLPDLCFVHPIDNDNPLPTFSIEIKPKCGFLPSASKLNLDNIIKTEVCRFCMHKHLKMHSKKLSSISQYCPLDLFSGCPERMTKALKSLFRTPQNNLRLFKDGSVIWCDERKTEISEDVKEYFPPVQKNGLIMNGKKSKDDLQYIDSLLSVITQALLHVPKPKDDESQSQKDFTSLLPAGCVLDAVLNVQKLDFLDIEGVYSLYEMLSKHLQDHPDDRENWKIDGPYDGRDGWLVSTETFKENTMQYALQKVKEYLVSRTAKDCSIMIAVQPIVEWQDDKVTTNLQTIQYNGCHYRFSVTTIDLDTKSFDKMPFYMEQDREIIQHYKKIIKEEGGQFRKCTETLN